MPIPGLDSQSRIRDWEICNPGILGFRFKIRLTDWSLFWHPELTYFIHWVPIRTVEWQWLSKYKFPATVRISTRALTKYFIHQTAKNYFGHLIREKVQIELIFVIPKSRDWDAANPEIRDWRKRPKSRDSGLQSLMPTYLNALCSL